MGFSIVFGIAGILIAASARSVAAQEPGEPKPATLNGPYVLTEKKVRFTGGDNNVVRSGPGNNFAIVGVYPGGAEFLVIAKRAEWYNVRISDIDTGWIHSSLCEEFDDMSGLEFRPNPRLFSRVGSFAGTAYAGGYAFDRKSNSFVLGGRLGYYVLEFMELEGSLAWTHVVRPAEIVESLFNLTLEEEDFHLLFYAMNANFHLMPGRQMVPFVTLGAGSSIMQGETETSINYGAGIHFFVRQNSAFRFEFRNYRFNSGTSDDRKSSNYEFTVGTTLLF
jgi:outer membrane beta-barrel protein